MPKPCKYCFLYFSFTFVHCQVRFISTVLLLDIKLNVHFHLDLVYFVSSE